MHWTHVFVLACFALTAACQREEPEQPIQTSLDTNNQREEPGGKEPIPTALDTYRKGQVEQFQHFDENRDNVVAYAGLPKRVARKYGRMDSNDDGQVSFEELERGIAENFAKADVNKDGILQPTEQ